ncbi:MAG: DUF1592 domain-containing protein [Myxococcales bacterium]|nr:DUF1592 domain-containing protein [Myxococcales bacterium]
MLGWSLSLAGCVGLVGGGDGGSTGPENGRVVQGIAVGEGFLRRLTRAQYEHAVGDLFDRSFELRARLPGDDTTLGFDLGKNISQAHVEAYFVAAEAVAAEVTEDLDALLGCGATPDRDCVGAFADDFGRRAFRRPLSGDERSRLLGLYDAGLGSYGAREGVEMLIVGALTSPHFLYIAELDPTNARAGDVLRLSSYEVATRLAFLLWDSGPDNELLDAAANDELASDDGILIQANRMLEDDRSRRGFRAFYDQWLQLQNLASLEKQDAPEFAGAMAADMASSFAAFIDEIVWEQNGGMHELLSSKLAYVPSSLATVYEVSVDDGAMMRMESVPNRIGLLTQPAILALTSKSAGSDPIHRGKFVRERVLCDVLTPPPPNLKIEFPEKTPGVSTRERFAQHRSDPSCNGCHRLIDPVGFGFENYDGLGNFRTVDNDADVDASGEVVDADLTPDDATGAFDGVEGLANLLKDSAKVRDCMTTQYFRYAFARGEGDADEATMKELRSARDAADGSITGMLAGVVTTDAFLHRKVGPREDQP